MPDIADIYKAHAPAVYWSAYSMTHNDSTAMDIMQSVFLKAIEHEKTLNCLAPAQVKSWLFTSTRNACIDNIRKHKRELLTDEAVEFEARDASTLPEASAITKEVCEAVYTAVDQLPEKYRQPILLYYFAQMQQNEIAAYLDINESTLRSLMKRAKAKLMIIMQEGGVLCNG